MIFADTTAQRQLALRHAVALLSPLGTSDANHVTIIADALFTWLIGPAFADITVGEIVDQTTRLPTGSVYTGGTMQLTDEEQVELTFSETDAKGVPL